MRRDLYTLLKWRLFLAGSDTWKESSRLLPALWIVLTCGRPKQSVEVRLLSQTSQYQVLCVLPSTGSLTTRLKICSAVVLSRATYWWLRMIAPEMRISPGRNYPQIEKD